MFANHKFFHWLYHTKNKRHVFNWSTGLFIWLFLGITRPFGISQNNFETYLLLLSSLTMFGALWPVVSYATDTVFKARIVHDHSMDFKVMGLKIVLLIHIFLIVRGTSCDWQCIDGLEYLELWIACFLMVGFCYLTFSLYGRYLFFRSLIGQSGLEKGIIRIEGEGKEKILLQEKDIIFIKSDDNYVDFECSEEQRKTLRATLSSVESQLKSYPNFVRIHRSYIVNMKCAESLPRRDTLKVRVNGQLTNLPVSRKYQPEISKLFAHPK